jgi:predicted RNase H-like HicB family nuclease
MTRTLKYIVQKEGKYYVSQCLNVDVSSFGNTVQEAIDNLNEALMETLLNPNGYIPVNCSTGRSFCQ